MGIDISEGLIRLARDKVPNTKFEVADIEEFEIPKEVDVVFAFVSLLHVDVDNFSQILKRIFFVININGIVRISLKCADSYQEIEKKDQFGVRTFYLYSKKDIEELAKDFKILKHETFDLRGQKWLEVTLQR